MADKDETPQGYHIAKIAKGVYGEDSKIYEEVDEFADALDQKNPVMALCEASDIIGAIDGWLDKNHPSITIDDLRTMSDATKRAFLSGDRTPAEGVAE